MNDEDSVTVVIPCLNEADTLAKTFESISNQSRPPEKIFFVDGGSDDGSKKIALNWSETLPIKILENPERRQAPGLNRALQRVESTYFARLDGHTYWNSQYLEKLTDALDEEPKLGAAGGVVKPAHELTRFQRTAWDAMTHPLSTGNPTYRTSTKTQYVKTVQSPVYRSQVMKSLNGFREDLPWAEDGEFHNRLKNSGWKLKLIPDAKIFYYPREDHVQLIKQHYHYGQGRALLSNRNIFPSDRHEYIDTFLIVWTGLLCWNPVGWTIGTILLTSYLFSSIRFYGSVRSKSMTLLYLIASMQFSYWLGWTKKREPRIKSRRR